MAATTIGTSGLQFGLTTETIGLVQSFTETRNVEKQEVKNQSGETVGVAFYNPTTAYSLSFNSVSANYATTAGASLAAIANAVTVGTVRIDSVTINKTNDSFVSIDISATGYPNVS